MECCGTAASFGYKSEYYELSTDVGGDLHEEFADETDRRLVASETACTEQMGELFARDVTHPVELLDPGR